MIEKITLSEVERNLPSGTPDKIRALNASGGISTDLKTVAKALPKKNELVIVLEPDETYSFFDFYNTAFLYETTSIGEGCIALLGWRTVMLWGSSLFANSDKLGNICIYSSKQGEYTIINRTSEKRNIVINIV